MENKHLQKATNWDTYKNLMFGHSIQRYCMLLLLSALLILLGQNVSLAADSANQSSEKGKKQNISTTIRQVYESNLPMEDKIDNIIQILSAESVKDSLSKLDEVDMYIRNLQLYLELPPDGIPLHTLVGKRDIIAIMGNRRFLKVTHELSLLPKEESAALVSNEITSSLNEYKRLFDSYMAKNDGGFKRNLKNPKGARSVPLLFYHHVEDGTPTLSAVRFKVLALALIAGNLQLQQTQTAVSKLLETAMEQKDIFYDKGAFHKRDAWGMLMKGSLYNRQIIGTTVLGTYTSSAEGEQILKDFYCKLKSERLTRYNATTILHDDPILNEKPVDYSKGEFNIKYLEPLDDVKFDGIVNAATQVMQQNITPIEPKE